jgi:hypothetical protein
MELSTVFVVMRCLVYRVSLLTPIAVYVEEEAAEQHAELARTHPRNSDNPFDKGLAAKLEHEGIILGTSLVYLDYQVVEIPFALHVDQYQEREYKLKETGLSQTIDKE